MKKADISIRILTILCAASVAVMVLALCFGGREAEFVPPPFEAGAQTGTPAVPENLGWQALDAGAFRVSLCGKVCPEDGNADIWFTNPAENRVWLRLRVLDEAGNILGQTGILRPGEYVRRVTLSAVPEAGTPIVLKVMAYEPETYRSAGALTLNTVIAGE